LGDSAILVVVILFAMMHWLGFIALGILTTQVNIGNVVRPDNSTNCGYWWFGDKAALGDEPYSVINMELFSNTTIAAENYERNCYAPESSSISECNTFMRRSFPHYTEMVPCPFHDERLCIGPKGEAFAMDSGNITFADYGLNWPHAKDVSIRRRSVCTPFSTAPFIYDTTTSRAYVEQNISGNVSEPENIGIYAFATYGDGTNITQTYLRNGHGEYLVSVLSLDNGTLALEALKPKMITPELTFITLQGRSITFPAPSNDPWFYAQEKVVISLDPNATNMSSYAMSRSLNGLACQDMAMICSNITDFCSPWTGPGVLSRFYVEILGQLSARKDAQAAFRATAFPLMFSTMYYGVNNRGASALQATRHIQSGRQYLTSDNQWKVEVDHWFRTGLAIFQMSPHRMISTPELDRTRVGNSMNMTNPGETAACTMIKFRSTKHVTLSLFGVLTILILCVVLTLISYLDGFLNLLFPIKVSPFLLPWEQSDYLHLLERSDARDGEDLGVSAYVEVPKSVVSDTFKNPM
jgi:hypothetical protein